MFSIQSRKHYPRAAVFLALSLAGLCPAAAQVCGDPPTVSAPYVFILFDTSGSMNWSSKCTQTQLDAGQCSFLCPTGDCFVPFQSDDPASKLFQIKEALHTVLADLPPAHFGFASFNQDSFRVKAKHWLYQAQSPGVSIPGVGPYPALGAQEVFGASWACDGGSGDQERGCNTTTPAVLPDLWNLNRVQRLPKGGVPFNQSVTVYLRVGSTTYKATYTPFPGSTLGAATVTANVRIDRCTNTSCTTAMTLGQSTFPWTRVGEFLAWDNSARRINPELGYFDNSTGDASSTNSCIGWESNTDSAADSYLGYNLLWPTDSSDPRGSSFSVGDVIPLDWLNDHNEDIRRRLAPNLNLGELTPDFRVSRYLNDLPQAAQQYLRLKDERARPLIAMGQTPLGASIRSFRLWYQAWEQVAAANDPEWLCRRKALIVISDNPYDCGTQNAACTEAGTLYSQLQLNTYAVSFGSPAITTPMLSCLAAQGGTESPYIPQTKQELIDTLTEIITGLSAP